MKKFTKEEVTKKLQELQAQVPSCYTKHLLSEELIAPEFQDIYNRASADKEKMDSLDEKTKRKWKVLGEVLQQKKTVENEKAIKRFNRYLDKLIKKAIKNGELPAKDTMTYEKPKEK